MHFLYTFTILLCSCIQIVTNLCFRYIQNDLLSVNYNNNDIKNSDILRISSDIERDKNENKNNDFLFSLSKSSSEDKISEKSSAHNKEEKEKKADISDISNAEDSVSLQISHINITEDKKKKRIKNSQTESLSVFSSLSSLISVCELSALSSLSIFYCHFLSVSLFFISHCCSVLFILSSVLISAVCCLTFHVLCIKHNVTAVFNSFVSNETDKINELRDQNSDIKIVFIMHLICYF